MFPKQASPPAANASSEPRRRLPADVSRCEKPSATNIGTRPSVESACVRAGESDSPMNFPKSAQAPQQKTANIVQSTQGRIIFYLSRRSAVRNVPECDHAGGGQARTDREEDTSELQ